MAGFRQVFNSLLSTRNRLAAHLLLWLVYYLYRVMIYIDIYPNTPIVQLVELLCILPVVYLNLYVFLPKYLKQGKILGYGLLLSFSVFATVIFFTEMIRVMMLVGIYTPGYDTLYSGWKLASKSTRFTTIVLATSGIKILKDAYLTQQINQKIEKDKLENELKFLKSQINPHFLFNTLNNLYALVKQKSDLAPQLILKLSSLMRYMLYETNHRFSLLSKEIEALEDYIELEKLRFGDELNVNFNIQGSIQNQEIVPVLLIPIVENSFKHGAKSVAVEQWIKIELTVNSDQLTFKVENSVQNDQEAQTGGIGLENIRRRLELIYKDHYSFKTKKKQNHFVTLMTIDLSGQQISSDEV